MNKLEKLLIWFATGNKFQLSQNADRFTVPVKKVIITGPITLPKGFKCLVPLEVV